MGSARPVRRFDALRAHSWQAFRRPKSPEAPLALSRPFRGLPPRSRKAPPTRRSACRILLPLMDFLTLRHTRGTVVPFAVHGSRRRRVPSPGFGYPPLGVHHRPYRRAKRRSALGLLPSRPSPRRGRRPFRGPGPLGVTAASPHRGVRRDTADFRALISRRARSGIGLRRTRPSMPSWDSPLQSLLPIRSGMRFGRAAGPPTHLAGRRPGPPGSQGFAKRMDRLGPSPDCRLSWGSLPFDRRGAPFAGSGGGLMDSPRARCRVCTTPRALSPLDADATRGPDP
jgi:hypothetical protein